MVLNHILIRQRKGNGITWRPLEGLEALKEKDYEGLDRRVKMEII